MEQLIAAQRELHRRIARTSENLRKAGAAKITVALAQSTLLVLDKKWAKFEAQHDRLEADYGDQLAGTEYVTGDCMSQAEVTYLQQRAYLLELQEALAAPRVSDEPKPIVSEATSSRSALPRIQLPQFSGRFEDWPAFRDLFTSIVVQENSVSKVEKMHYLKTSVKGDAEQLIRNLPSTGENFDRAWTILTAHFENKRLLVRSYLAAFTSLPKMKSDSASDLRRIFHGVISTVGALEGIGRPISNGSDLFVHLVTELLDAKTRREWESSLCKSSDPPSYDELRAFLQEQLMTQEAIRVARGDPPGKPSDKAGRAANHARSQAPDPTRRCPLCKGNHYIAFCGQYKKMTAKERRETVTTHQRCWNCLGRHMAGECSSNKNCDKCSGRHHSTLHDAFASASGPAVASASDVESTVHVAGRRSEGCTNVLLATARVLVTDRHGVRHSVRALVDPGSETSLIAEALAQRLRLPRTPASVAIFGVGGMQTGHSRGRIAVVISARTGQFNLSVSALVLPRLTVYGGAGGGDVRSWSHVSDLVLADSDVLNRDPVELLLGADAYASIVMPDLRRGGPLEPIAQRTRLGWILLGAVGTVHAASVAASLQCSAAEDLSSLVRRFWESEEPPAAAVPLSADDQVCEDHFVQTHRRLPDGRYQVRLPTRPGLPSLAITRRAAAHMLGIMERKFERDPIFKARYQEFMAEYLALGHMAPVTPGATAPEARACYLPHHGVVKGSGPEARIRVVFNGSSRTPIGSLNDHLRAGPNLLPALADVLTRWRRHRYVLVADIEKMYRQIRIHPEDRNLQRVLWRKDVRTLEFCLDTVTYGLASAPYLAIRALRQLASDEEARFPLAAEALRRDTYMDDILTGASDLNTARRLQGQISSLCMAGGFPLKKWAANHAALLEDVPAGHQVHPTEDASLPTEDHSVLGLRWRPSTDDFAISVRGSVIAVPTKRTLLSQSARLFDPLGWLAPLIIRAKLLIQNTWLQQLDWDTPLAGVEAAAWSRLEEELHLLEHIRIPRWLHCSDSEGQFEIHGFSDASERAYAAVVYLRTTAAGRHHVSLLLAKTKVAPLKRVSLPRLELCAAALLAKLVAHIRAVLSLDISATHLWTDSTVALGWIIRGHPARWTTFVANRTAEIQRLTAGARWRHVPGGINPADCASRGVSPRELLEHSLWWRGPEFLTEDAADWPADLCRRDSVKLPEQRGPQCLMAAPEREPEELTRFSALRRLLRVSSWMHRWRTCSAAGGGAGSVSGSLMPDELEAALSRWIRVAQAVAFRAELEDVRAGRAVSGRSSLRRLTPTMDGEGILRVGGRLKYSLLDRNRRHPIILPAESHLTQLLVDAEHRRTLHGGTQTTLAALRQRFWILRGRQLVKRLIYRCLPCARWLAATPQPLMGNLPGSRVTPSRPFLHVGVDFAGPIYLRASKGRGHTAYKAYLSVFVCFSSRAVHLEAVSDYSADAFLAAFRRFVSRRGLCRDVYSDCGTNFVGADSQLRALFRPAGREVRRIAERLADDGIRWHFNPPAAPHFGGLWEAAVKALKHHLRRVIGETRLTYEEMATFLAEVEACLNSRPLQALTDDPEDLDALTPGHFLVGAPLNSIPEPSLLETSTSRLNRWRLLQQMRDHVWLRWSRDYIQGLTPRPKWWKTSGGLKEGQLCLLKNETTPPSRWPLARVVRLHPDKDGHVRVVDVKTVTGEFTRPVVKVVPLPVANADD